LDINLQGAKYLVSLIENNPFVANINLTGNQLQPQGVQKIGNALESNDSIIKLQGVVDSNGNISSKINKNYQLLHNNLAKLVDKTFTFEEKEELHKNLLILAKQIQATAGGLLPQTLTNKEIGTGKEYLKLIKDLFSEDIIGEFDNPYFSILSQTDLLGCDEEMV